MIMDHILFGTLALCVLYFYAAVRHGQSVEKRNIEQKEAREILWLKLNLRSFYKELRRDLNTAINRQNMRKAVRWAENELARYNSAGLHLVYRPYLQ